MQVRAGQPGQTLGWLSSLLAALAVVAACAPAAPAPADSRREAVPAAEAAAGSSASTNSPPSAPAADRIVRGGTFVIGTHNDLINFDIVTQTGGVRLSVLGLVQSGLMKWGKTPVVDPGKVTCDLCESWTQIDAVTYEFKLRQGIRWHNLPPVNGREFTSEDVKYTLERLQTRNFRNDPRFAHHQAKVATIASIETPDRYTVRIQLKGPDAVFLWNLGDPFLLMVAREQVEAEPDGILQTGIVGTGPFMLQEFTPKVGYTLVRNPDYFIPELPYLDRIEVRIITDNTTRFNAFRAKEIHDPGVSMDSADKRVIDRQHPDLFMGEVPGMTISGVWLNAAEAPFNDARVRRAIHLATDRQAIIDATRFGRAELLRWLPPAMGAVATPSDEVAKLPGYRQPKTEDVATARQLLAEAGYPNGFSTELKANRSSSIPADAEVLIEQLRRNLNIDARLTVLEQAVFTNDFRSRNFRMAIDYGLSSVGDADEILSQFVGTSPSNHTQWKNQQFDELYPRQRAALNPTERAQIIGQMLAIMDEEVPVIPLYSDYNYRGYPRGCHGIQEEHRYNVLIRYMGEVWCEDGVLRR